MKIVLSEGELHLVEFMAKARTKVSRNDGVKNQRISEESDFDVEYVGMCGELAVARAMNVYPDLSIASRSGGFDLLSHKGMRMEVKTTKHSTGRLVARLKAKAEDSDYYVLVTGVPPIMTLQGYIPTEEFLTEARVGQLSPKYPKAFLATQSELTPWPIKKNQSPPGLYLSTSL